MRIVMNPTRQRIIQALALKQLATTGELGEQLTDIPKASLYRHIGILQEGGLIEVAEEERVRGTVQRHYRLAQQPVAPENGMADVSTAFLSGLLSLYASFQQYFADSGHNPMTDRLFLSTSTLMMTDEEFAVFVNQLGALIAGQLENTPSQGRKPRRFTFISSPCEE